MAGALQGIRVIDFGHQVAGPLAAVMLADQGAEVIHIDRPGAEDRSADAFFLRGKKRIRLDLKDPADAEIARRLVESADVVIENFRPGVMDRLGLGAKEMTAPNRRLVYCSLPGFPEGDPRAGMRAWEGIIDAATDNARPRAGEPPPEWDSSLPTYSALTLASNFAAFQAVGAIVFALIARERTGRGQRIEAALFDSMFTLIGQNGAYLNERGWREPTGIHGRGAGCFRCGDGRYVQFDTSSARHLTWFAHAAGIDHWGEALDITRLQDPQANEALHARLRELFLTRPAAEWERIGNEAGASIGMIRTSTEWLHEGHARVIGAVTRLEDPVLGPTLMAGLPVRLSLTDGEPGEPRHLPDADREEILARLAPAAVADERPVTGAPPLDGLRVLDLCLALAGPTSGRLLAEAGASVIKVYPPDGGAGGYLNRGKRSLLFDLDTQQGRELFWKLVEDADVLVQNFAPGTAERLGIGYDQVKARRPDIVYTSVSCYGRGGPWSPGRGWERQGQAVTGVMERTGAVPAILGPYNLVDIGTGTLATFGTALALYHRARTGEGQHVSASLVQTGTYHQVPYMLDYAGATHDEPRGYEAQGTGPLNRYYRASDGWFFLAAAGAEAELSTLMQVDLSSPDLESSLIEAFAADSAETWVAKLQAVGVAAHAVTPLARVMVDDQVLARGLSITQEVAGREATMPGIGVRLSETPLRVAGTVHQPGSDAAEVLEEIGWADRLEALERAWVLRTRDLPPTWAGGG
jgi:crotonobetainyl-CoA:carnitine CoA-transferase CaiB-like acyl-CoA transferase